MYVCVYTYYIYIYYVYVSEHICIHIYIYTCVYIYVHMYVHIYVYIYIRYRCIRIYKVYILQNVAAGTREEREFIEDRSITRLNTKSPNGTNSNLKDFAKTFYSLF